MTYDHELYDFDYIIVLKGLQILLKNPFTIDKWLNASNVLLRGHTPLHKIYTGKAHEVLDIIEAQL